MELPPTFELGFRRRDLRAQDSIGEPIGHRSADHITHQILEAGALSSEIPPDSLVADRYLFREMSPRFTPGGRGRFAGS